MQLIHDCQRVGREGDVERGGGRKNENTAVGGRVTIGQLKSKQQK